LWSIGRLNYIWGSTWSNGIHPVSHLIF
jgi:hypothetical protein